MIEKPKRRIALRVSGARSTSAARATKSTPSTPGGHRVHPSHAGDGHEEQGERRRGDRVAEHLGGRSAQTDDRGHHRNVGGFVLVAVLDREGPEVRWGPEEDHPEQHQGLPGELVRHRRPPDEGGNRPGRTTYDDVLLRRPLQPDRVHEHVEEGRQRSEGGAEQVDEAPEPGEGHDLERDREDERLARRHEPGDQRSAGGARHQRVDVTVYVHVDGVGAASGHRPADHGRRDEPSRRHSSFGHHHGRHRRHQQQLDDAGLRERDEAPELPGEGARGGDRGLDRHCRGPANQPSRFREVRGPIGIVPEA